MSFLDKLVRNDQALDVRPEAALASLLGGKKRKEREREETEQQDNSAADRLAKVALTGNPSDTAAKNIVAENEEQSGGGGGGPNVGNIFNRLIYALKFQSTDILFSDAVNEESQILYDRDPATRVQKAAPYLELDNDPYPSVVNGRIVWIVDGYTLSANYPYSSIVSLREAISDTQTTASPWLPQRTNAITLAAASSATSQVKPPGMWSWVQSAGLAL